MSDPADAPAKPAHNLRGAVLWTAGILVALGLAWFVAAVVVPCWQVRQVIAKNARPGIIPQSAEEQVADLGGPEPACAKLLLYLRLPDSVARGKWGAWRLLGHCGRTAVPGLIGWLRSPEPYTRRAAAHALWLIGRDAVEAVPALRVTLEDSDPDVRRQSFNALGAIGPAAKDALPTMEKFWRNPPPYEGGSAGTFPVPMDADALDKVRGTK